MPRKQPNDTKKKKLAQPIVSPFSMSVWQDLRDVSRWCWSIQKGVVIVKSGIETLPQAACDNAKTAMGNMLRGR